MSMGHRRKKQFIEKEIYQKSSYCSDTFSETYTPRPCPIPKRLKFTLLYHEIFETWIKTNLAMNIPTL